MRALNASTVQLETSLADWSRQPVPAGEVGEGRRKHWTKGFPLLITQSITSSGIADQMSLKIPNLSFCWWALLSRLANSLLSSFVHRRLPTTSSTLTHGNVGLGLNLDLNNYPELFRKEVGCVICPSSQSSKSTNSEIKLYFHRKSSRCISNFRLHVPHWVKNFEDGSADPGLSLPSVQALQRPRFWQALSTIKHLRGQTFGT